MVSTTTKLSSGDEMPIVGLGTWKSKPGEVAAAVKYALQIGYRHLDCAFVYGNENEVGQGIKEAMEEFKIERKEIWVTSKLWSCFHHPEEVEGACRESLKNLGLDYLDLYLIHWPTAFKRGEGNFPKNEDGSIKYDVDLHPTNTWSEMEKLVHKGLVKNIGLSNFNSHQIQDILDKGKIKPTVNQVEVHPYLSQQKLIKFCKEHEVIVTAYSPLGSPDRPWAQPDEPKLLEDPKLVDIAKKYGKSPAQVLLRWCIQRGVQAIPKSVTFSRIKENFEIFDFVLTAEEMTHLDSFECGGRVVVPKIDGKFRDAAHPHFPFNIEF